MASTPVSAVAPDEKARATRKIESPATASSSSSAVSARGQPSVAHRHAPYASVDMTTRTNPYVGIAKSIPASFAPRRLAIVITPMNAIASQTFASASSGIAEVTAIAPAVTLTATVRT